MTRRIHIVDDDEEVRSSMSLLLTTFGFDVICYSSGDRFLESSTPEEEDLILLDVRMPGKNGFEVLAELRARGNASKVILITGHATIELATYCEKSSVIALLEKPFDPMELVDMLGRP